MKVKRARASVTFSVMVRDGVRVSVRVSVRNKVIVRVSVRVLQVR